MAIADRLLKKFNLFIEAKGYAGEVDELQLPKLAIKTEDFQGGGMDAPMEIDVGVEKLNATISLTGYDPDVIASWGLAEGNDLQLQARGALESADGSVEAVVVTMHGKINGLEMDPWKPAATSKLKFTINCRYYAYRQDGRTLIEIDIKNFKRVINGVDQLAGMRSAIGL